MVSSELDTDVRALAYLLTTVIHRLHETDPKWWREFHGEVKADRDAVAATGALDDLAVLQKALAILDHSLAPQLSAPGGHG